MDAMNIMPNGLLCKHFHELNFQDWRSIPKNLPLYGIHVQNCHIMSRFKSICRENISAKNFRGIYTMFSCV